MMAKASNAFRTMTRGAYAGLTTQRDKDSEVLIAVGADGGSKIVAALSRGTRFQLYLALRVAGYHEFARSRPTVPFIADDIIEPFSTSSAPRRRSASSPTWRRLGRSSTSPTATSPKLRRRRARPSGCIGSGTPAG